MMGLVLIPCQGCSAEMPTDAVTFFEDDDETYAVCADTEACAARMTARKRRPGSTSFLMEALNQLTDRVAHLERSYVATLEQVEYVPEGPPELSLRMPSRATLPPYSALPSAVAATMAELGTAGVSLVHGDARAIPMDPESVDLVVTSPPYWAQRSYQDGGEHYTGQIGDEPTPGAYVDALVDCTRDWMRVLKPGGSIWVNLGDKYAGVNDGRNNNGISSVLPAPQVRDRDAAAGGSFAVGFEGVRTKSLVGLPWRYALACIDKLGLILRAEVIWSKPNGMPESVTDRVRRSHEQWFHFTKEPRYFSSVDVIRDEYAAGTARRYAAGYNPSLRGLAGAVSSAAIRSTAAGDGGPDAVNPLGKLPSSVWEVPTQPLVVPPELGADHFAAFPMEWPRRIIQGWCPAGVCTVCGEGRRPVKTVAREGGRIRKQADTRFLGKPRDPDMIPTGQDAPGAHAGYSTVHTIAGEACACTPYTDHPGTHVGVAARSGDALVPGNVPRSIGAPSQGPWREYHLDEWEPPPTRPGVVLDPFGGTGTTALVADVLGRRGVSVDMSLDYLRIAAWRTTDPVQRASAMQVPRPPLPIPGQLDLFDRNGSDGDGPEVA